MTAPAPAVPVDVPLGRVVEQALGVVWTVHHAAPGADLAGLAGLALRDNPRRAQLVVSRVLAKHLPVAPPAAVGAADRLGGLVRDRLGGAVPVVLGWCETATALGHLVAEALGADYVHTTRRPDPGVPLLAGFDEEHSHAPGHVLQPRDPAPLRGQDRPLVLVDDELTSGTTALNTIAALPPHARYVVASLLDLRPAAAREAFAVRAARLGVEVEVVALLDGELAVPDDVAERAARLRVDLAAVPARPAPDHRGTLTVRTAGWPPHLPAGGRTGTGPADRGAQEQALAVLAGRLAPRLGGRTLVVGTEELMWLPVRLAALLPGEVAVQSTTRSPVLPADLPGYAVRSALLAPAPDEPGRTTRLHGLPAEPYDDVVLVVDTPPGPARPLAEALRPWGDVAVVTL